MPTLEHRCDQKQPDSTDHEDVSHVEGWPVHGANIEIEEICHGPKSEAVHDVAVRASEDRTVGNCFDAVPCAKHHGSEPSTDSECKDHKAPPRRAAQKPEGHAIVPMEREIESGEHGNSSAQDARIRYDDGLCDLIDRKSREGGKPSDGWFSFERTHCVT